MIRICRHLSTLVAASKQAWVVTSLISEEMSVYDLGHLSRKSWLLSNDIASVRETTSEAVGI